MPASSAQMNMDFAIVIRWMHVSLLVDPHAGFHFLYTAFTTAT